MVREMPGIFGNLISNIRLETMCRMTKTWNPQSLAEGMEYLSEQTRMKKIFYDIWTPEEKRLICLKNDKACSPDYTNKIEIYDTLCRRWICIGLFDGGGISGYKTA